MNLKKYFPDSKFEFFDELVDENDRKDDFKNHDVYYLWVLDEYDEDIPSKLYSRGGLRNLEPLRANFLHSRKLEPFSLGIAKLL